VNNQWDLVETSFFAHVSIFFLAVVIMSKLGPEYGRKRKFLLQLGIYSVVGDWLIELFYCGD